MPWNHGDWIDDEDADGASATRWAFPPYVRQLFEQAGWTPTAPPAPAANRDAMAFAGDLLREFGGLAVGQTGPGIDMAANDIEFLPGPMRLEDSSSMVRRWPRLRGAAFIALAHREHIELIVDANGNFLAFTDPDSKLYDFGADFARFAEILLRGLRWPAAIAPSNA